MFEGLVIAWYFAIWGVGGGNFYTIGPFSAEQDCNEVRTQMLKDTIGLNTFSKCWKYSGR